MRECVFVKDSVALQQPQTATPATIRPRCPVIRDGILDEYDVAAGTMQRASAKLLATATPKCVIIDESGMCNKRSAVSQEKSPADLGRVVLNHAIDQGDSSPRGVNASTIRTPTPILTCTPMIFDDAIA